MLEKLIAEIERLRQADTLLREVLTECAEYGYAIDGMSPELLRRIQAFMDFDDSE